MRTTTAQHAARPVIPTTLVVIVSALMVISLNYGIVWK